MARTKKLGAKNTAGLVTGIGSRATTTLAVIVSALILSLATWYLFYLSEKPLNGADTSVVTGFWLIVVSLFKWTLKWLVDRHRKGDR
jgi:hypothetical protein